MKRLVLLLAFLGFDCLFTGTAFGNILSVPAEYTTIQAGIDAASSGDTVQVAAGTYYENISMKSGVLIHGAGQGVSIIDGGASGPVVTATGVSSSAKLDGFMITNGNTAEGGGMYNSNSSPMVSNCTFSGNTATANGGGMYNSNSSPTVSNCTFSENLASSFGISKGGGMYNYNNSSPTVINCNFAGNTSNFDGGGMSNVGSSPTVTNCNFTGNSANAQGGGMYNISSSPTVINCTFSENITGVSAGYGAGMSNEGSSPTVSKCSFFNNHSGIWGGGMSNLSNSSPIVTSCTFSGNLAQDDGGGMYNFYSSPTVSNCTFSGNTCSGWGDGMYNYNSSPTVINCTFSGNAGGFATLYNESNSSVTVTNCILWGDALIEIHNADTSSCAITYSDIQGVYSGTGNINADPMFMDQANGDLHLQQGSPSIDAGDNSAPALPPTDIDGDNRKIDDPTVTDTGNGTPPIVDMGADEYAPKEKEFPWLMFLPAITTNSLH